MIAAESVTLRNRETRLMVLGLVALALMGIAYLGGIAWVAVLHGWRPDRPLAWFEHGFLICAALGAIIVAAFAVHSRQRFGELPLTVDGRIAIGERLRLSVPVPTMLQADAIVRFALVCEIVERKGQHTVRSERWRGDAKASVVAHGQPSVAVEIELPTGLPHSQRVPGGDIEWSAQVSAAAPGLDLARSYSLTVARAAGAKHLPE
jgi:hypothetical protein